jgi:hypothetical protein
VREDRVSKQKERQLILFFGLLSSGRGCCSGSAQSFLVYSLALVGDSQMLSASNLIVEKWPVSTKNNFMERLLSTSTGPSFGVSDYSASALQNHKS